MRIDGRWAQDPDGEARPVFDGTIITPDGQHVSIELLLDTGADSVVLSPHVMQQLGRTVQPVPAAATADGVGGVVPLFTLDLDLVLLTNVGQRVRVRGPLPIALGAYSLDRSVLGRNFTNQFTLVCSRTYDVVSLLSPPDVLSVVHPLLQIA